MSNYDRREFGEKEPVVEETAKETPQAKTRHAVVNYDRLNVRHTPSMQGTIDTVITRGVRLAIIKDVNPEWAKVIVQDGTNRIGYVMKKYIEEI